MGARLITPEGEVFELTDELYAEFRQKIELSQQNLRQQQAQQLRDVLKQLHNDPHKESAGWWDDFENFLRQNRVHFPERNLGLGVEDE